MKITFQDSGKGEFYPTLKLRVGDYFKKKQVSSKANTILWVEVVAILLIQISLYLALVSNFLNGLFFVLIFSLFGLATGLINFIVVHGALHGSLSQNSAVNRLLGYLFDLNGISSYVWKLTHNTLHHTYTNIPGCDGDIDKAITLRLSPKDKLYPFHAYQHIYAFFLYALMSINWIFYGDYAIFFEQYKKGKVSLRDALLFFGFKLLNIFLVVMVPLWVVDLPIGIILFGYFCAHLAAGFSTAIIFQLAHIVDNVCYFEPDLDGNIPNNWALHEMLTTTNFCTGNIVFTHLLGGLNFQIEHHLFPYVSHVHYPALQKIVKATADECGIPYNENRTFLEAICSHCRRLRELGTKNNQSSSLKR